MKLPSLYSTTALTSRSPYVARQVQYRFEAARNRSNISRVMLPQQTSKNGSTAILVNAPLRVPTFNENDLSKIVYSDAEFITRHVKASILSQTLSGSFKFGTIEGYRPADKGLDGRFGDHQEGIQRDVYRSRNGDYNGELHGMSFFDVRINGFENPVTVQFSVNDYCSCSSRGLFSINRARRIRDNGNPDLGAYAVYDLKKLRLAIQSIVAEKGDTKHLKIISRNVDYGEKDRQWEFDGFLKDKADKDHTAIWLSSIFVKSHSYQHEDELRMILVDPSEAGNLPKTAEAIFLEDARIADAIVDSGTF